MNAELVHEVGHMLSDAVGIITHGALCAQADTAEVTMVIDPLICCQTTRIDCPDYERSVLHVANSVSGALAVANQDTFISFMCGAVPMSELYTISVSDVMLFNQNAPLIDDPDDWAFIERTICTAWLISRTGFAGRYCFHKYVSATPTELLSGVQLHDFIASGAAISDRLKYHRDGSLRARLNVPSFVGAVQ